MLNIDGKKYLYDKLDNTAISEEEFYNLMDVPAYLQGVYIGQYPDYNRLGKASQVLMDGRLEDDIIRIHLSSTGASFPQS